MASEWNYRHRNAWNLSRKEKPKTFRRNICSSISTIEEKPIEIRHVSSNPFKWDNREFFFTYTFLLDNRQKMEGYIEGTKLFVGPDHAIGYWLSKYDGSFYKIDEGEKVPSVFALLDNPVIVPYSTKGIVCADKGNLVYLVGDKKWDLGKLLKETTFP